MKVTCTPDLTVNASGLKLNRLLESGRTDDFFQELERLKRSAPSMLLVRDQNGQTPLHCAAYTRQEWVLERLISSTNWEGFSSETQKAWLEPDHFGRSPLWRAVEAGLFSILPRLFHLSFHGMNHRDKVFDRGLLHLAAEHNNSSLLKWLLQHIQQSEGFFPDYQGHSPLHRACLMGRSESVSLLLSTIKAGPLHEQARSPDHQGQNPLHLACLSGDLDTLSCLLEHSMFLDSQLWGADSCGHNPLHLVVIREETSLIQLILSKAPHLEALCTGNLVKATPLHLAAKSHSLELLKTLLQNPIASRPEHLLVEDIRGRSPLDLAARAGRAENLAALLDALGDNKVPPSPRLLSHCAFGESSDCLRVLLQSSLREGVLAQLFDRDVSNQMSPLQSLSTLQLRELLEDPKTPDDLNFIIKSRLSLREGNLTDLAAHWRASLRAKNKIDSLVPLILKDRTLTDFLCESFPELIPAFLKEHEGSLSPRQKEGVLDYLSHESVLEVIKSWEARDLLRLSLLPVSVDPSFSLEAYRLLKRLWNLKAQERDGAEETIKSMLPKIPTASLLAMAQRGATRPFLESLLSDMPDHGKNLCTLSLEFCPATSDPSDPESRRKHPPKSFFVCPERRLPQMWEVVVQERGIKPTRRGWDIWFPCEHHGVDRQLAQLKPACKDSVLLAIGGADCFHRKERLFPLLEKAYGWNTACQFMPATYALKNPKDRARFSANFSNGKTYILKKNQHGKQGILLSQSHDDILAASEKGFVIAQDFLTHTYRFLGHQIITRRYLAVHTLKGQAKAYLHPLGLSNVSSQPYQEHSLDPVHQTTTSHQPNELFRRLPGLLTLLKEDLIHNNYDFVELETKTHELMASVIRACQDQLGRLDQVQKCPSYELFGVDLIWQRIDAIGTCPLHPLLIEVNRGPDLTPKESRPYVYAKVARDFLSLSIGEPSAFQQVC